MILAESVSQSVFNLFSSMRSHIQFPVFKTIKYLLILFVTDALFVGQYVFL